MYQDVLELPQRVIAFARIGGRPPRTDIEAAIKHIDEAQKRMRNHGQSALALDTAKAVLTTLRWGYKPHQEDCIAAVSTLASIMNMAAAEMQE